MGLVRPGSPIWDVALNCPYDLAVKTSTSTDKEGKPYRNLYVNARLGGPLTGDVPSDGVVAQAITPMDVDDVPFAWREVTERGQRTEHNPFA
jgi:hypothetical protein